VYVSKSYAAMLGRSADDIVGKPIVDFIVVREETRF
jgi:PAS domain-containing protein